MSIDFILNTLAGIEDSTSFVFYQKDRAMGDLYRWYSYEDGRLEIVHFLSDEKKNLWDILKEEGVLISTDNDPYCVADNYIQEIEYDVLEGSLWWQRVCANNSRKKEK